MWKSKNVDKVWIKKYIYQNWCDTYTQKKKKEDNVQIN